MLGIMACPFTPKHNDNDLEFVTGESLLETKTSVDLEKMPKTTHIIEIGRNVEFYSGS